MEKDENENSCVKIESNGDATQEFVLPESITSFRDIKADNENVLNNSENHQKILPKIDINDIKRMEDFELHRKILEEQVKNFLIDGLLSKRLTRTLF